MSEHAWTQDQMAAYVAGGLDAPEAERLEAHLRDCAECAAALEEAHRFDRGLETLFAPARPGPALEDRMIRSLHVIRAVDLMRPRWKNRLLWTAAATVGLGLTGAAMSVIARDGALPFPGMDRPFSQRGTAIANALDEARGGTAAPASASFPVGTKGARLPTSDGESRLLRDPEKMAQELSDQVQKQFKGASNKEGDSSVLSMDGSNAVWASNGSYPGAGFGPSNKPASRDVEATGELDRHRSSSLTYAPTKLGSDPDTHARKTQANDIPYLERQFKPLELWARPQEDSKVDNKSRKDPENGKQDPKPAGDSGGKSEPKPNPDRERAVGAVDPAPARRVIRTGEIEFEVESFDSALASVIKLVGGIKGGYVGTVNSDKLANGKVKGSIVVRVPPEALDTLVLDLRRDLGKGGELKGQRIGSQDITKQYTDLESRLRAARTMETRLLQIIKEGKGEIKQLLEAEKELGVWRTRIEEMEGERRYFDNQVSLSTLTIVLAEKEIKTAATVTENERIQAGVEVEDVEKAQQQLLAAVTDAKGRVTRSELKQHSAGQFNATVHFEVAPEQAGPLRDRLRQLGLVTRFESDRTQQAEGGAAAKDARPRRGDTIFQVQLYNGVNIAARETATLQVAALDVPAAYRALREAIGRANGRLLKSDLNEQDRRNIVAQLDFEVRRSEEEAIRAAFAAAGDTITRNVARATGDENTTDAKVFFRTSLISATALPPRETTSLGIEVADVDKTATLLAAQVGEVKGRVVSATVSHERNGRMAARLIYDVPLAAAASLAERFKSAGAIRTQQTTRDERAHDGPLAVARLDVSLANAELILPHDDGLWQPVRKGLSWSASVLLMSLSWVIVGLCVVLPWGLVGYAGYRLSRRLFRSPPEPVAAPAAPPPPAAG